MNESPAYSSFNRSLSIFSSGPTGASLRLVHFYQSQFRLVTKLYTMQSFSSIGIVRAEAVYVPCGAPKNNGASK